MNEALISLFIDNELDIDGKITFVETVHSDENFKFDTVDLLVQEKLIRSDVANFVPSPIIWNGLPATRQSVRHLHGLNTARPPAIYFGGSLK